MAIPESVLVETAKLVEAWTQKTHATRHDLQVLLGKLFHSAKCSSSARLFVGRMLHMLRAAPSQGTISLPSGFKKDLRWFSRFLPRYNGIALIHINRTISHITLSSSTGTLSVQWEDQLCTAPVPPELTCINSNTSHVVLFSVLVAVLLWVRVAQGQLYIFIPQRHIV